MKKIIAFLLIPTISYASSCCGGGASSSLIILGDNKAELGIGINNRTDFGQTNDSGYSYLNGQKITDYKNTINIEGKFSISDYLQAAIKLGSANKHVRKNGFEERHSGLTDLETQISYEFLPEFGYHPYKPRGFFYTKMTIPLSHSIYNSDSKIQSDVLGSGFYSLLVGSLFVKKLNEIQLKISFEINHNFARSFSNFKINGFEKFIIPIGASYAISNTNLTIGFNNSFNYTTAKEITNVTKSISGPERYFDTSIFINYSNESISTYSLSYSDSSLIGKSINSPLYRTIALNYTYNIPL